MGSTNTFKMAPRFVEDFSFFLGFTDSPVQLEERSRLGRGPGTTLLPAPLRSNTYPVPLAAARRPHLSSTPPSTSPGGALLCRPHLTPHPNHSCRSLERARGERALPLRSNTYPVPLAAARRPQLSRTPPSPSPGAALLCRHHLTPITLATRCTMGMKLAYVGLWRLI